jgi:hypothetical protein
VSEILQMTVDEFEGWLAYFKLEHERTHGGK